MKTLACVRDPIRNWDYTVTDESGDVGGLAFEWPFERGIVQTGGRIHRILKHGSFSGRWTLECGEEVAAEGNKPSMMSRRYVLQFGTRQISLKPEFIFIRPFQIVENEQVLGRIAPVHPLAWDSTVRCSDSVPKLIQLFCLWLTVLSWRRYL
jgi:hypothetical protein